LSLSCFILLCSSKKSFASRSSLLPLSLLKRLTRVGRGASIYFYRPCRMRLPSFAIALSYSSEVYLKIPRVEGLNLLTAGS